MLGVRPEGAAQEEGFMNRITNTPIFTTRIIGVVEADCPEDGGKWALYCEHENGVGILQDTNRKRISAWGSHSVDWCPICQDIALEVK
jgi:hypothetical protein